MLRCDVKCSVELWCEECGMKYAVTEYCATSDVETNAMLSRQMRRCDVNQDVLSIVQCGVKYGVV